MEGLANGTFITISKDVPVISTTRSTDGHIARTVRRDDSYTLTLSVVQTSVSNTILSRLFAADRVTYQGKFPIFIKDNNGSTVFAAGTCWITSEPNVSFSNGIEVREWVIQCAEGGLYSGDNEQGSGAVVDAVVGLAAAFAPNLRDFL